MPFNSSIWSTAALQLFKWVCPYPHCATGYSLRLTAKTQSHSEVISEGVTSHTNCWEYPSVKWSNSTFCCLNAANDQHVWESTRAWGTYASMPGWRIQRVASANMWLVFCIKPNQVWSLLNTRVTHTWSIVHLLWSWWISTFTSEAAHSTFSKSGLQRFNSVWLAYKQNWHHSHSSQKNTMRSARHLCSWVELQFRLNKES